MESLKELYSYRTMISSLVKKNLKGKYKRSVLGFLWIFINPLLQLVVYTLVFSVIMRSNIDQYYLFLFVALIPWIFFANCLTNSSKCIIEEKEMIKKIYFPRAVLPISSMIGDLVNMLLSFIVVIAVLLISGRGVNLLVLPALLPVIGVQILVCLGFSFLVSGLTVYVRDMEYVLGIVAMAWQYATPVMYDVSIVPDRLLPIFNINPMSRIIESYRDILYYKSFPNFINLLYPLIFGVALVIVGYLIFNVLQKKFAERF